MAVATESPVAEMTFQYRYVKDRQTTGWRNKKGALTSQALLLDGESIPLERIVDTTSRDNRIIIRLAETDMVSEKLRKEIEVENALILEIYKIKTKELEKQIDRYTSAIAAERNRMRLRTSGQEGLFRAVVCPHCSATIDLSDAAATPLVYCRFCETTLTASGEVVTNGENYRICDHCGMFDRVKGYDLFYFYFLIVVYGWRTERRHMCDNCAQKEGVKTLLINLIFLLGVPPALYNLWKVRSGRDSRFAELAKANALARKGSFTEADRLFRRLLDSQNHPGIWMNQGIGHLNGGDMSGAVESLRQSLQASSNYQPTHELLQRLSQAVGGPKE